MPDTPDMRAEFEAWAQGECFDIERGRRDGGYSDPETGAAWHGYQAAWNRRTPAAELSDERLALIELLRVLSDEPRPFANRRTAWVQDLNRVLSRARAILAEAKGKL